MEINESDPRTITIAIVMMLLLCFMCILAGYFLAYHKAIIDVQEQVAENCVYSVPPPQPALWNLTIPERNHTFVNYSKPDEVIGWK